MTDKSLAEAAEKTLSDGEVVKRLWGEIKVYIGPLFLAASLYLPLVLGQLAQPLIVGFTIDEGMRLLQATKNLPDKKKDDTDPNLQLDGQKDGGKVPKVDDDGFGGPSAPEGF